MAQLLVDILACTFMVHSSQQALQEHQNLGLKCQLPRHAVCAICKMSEAPSSGVRLLQGTEDEMKRPRNKGGTGLGLSICSKQVSCLLRLACLAPDFVCTCLTLTEHALHTACKLLCFHEHSCVHRLRCWAARSGQ